LEDEFPRKIPIPKFAQPADVGDSDGGLMFIPHFIS